MEENKEVLEVSKNFIEQEIEKDLAEGVYDHVQTRFHQNLTDIFILDMQSPYYLTMGLQRNTMVSLI